MKLFYAPTSPYVRKVLVVAHETGQASEIAPASCNASPVNADAEVIRDNPLGKIPTLVTDDGQTLFDSRVICEYLDAQGQGGLFPSAGEARWTALTHQALADGLLDAAILCRYEAVMRPQEKQWDGWRDGQMGKVSRALDQIEASLDEIAKALTIGTIATGCALGYLDFRFPEVNWRAAHPRSAEWFEAFGARPSMEATRPAEARPA